MDIGHALQGHEECRVGFVYSSVFRCRSSLCANRSFEGSFFSVLRVHGRFKGGVVYPVEFFRSCILPSYPQYHDVRVEYDLGHVNHLRHRLQLPGQIFQLFMLLLIVFWDMLLDFRASKIFTVGEDANFQNIFRTDLKLVLEQPQ